MPEMTIFDALTKAAGREKALNPVGMLNAGWKVISEAFTGAWQRNISETRSDLFAYPTLYACIARIAKDIGAMPFVLKQRDANGIWSETTNPAYSPVLRRPNHYQTAAQLRESWQLSKLTQGNTYVLKGYDERGVVNRLYVLDPCRVKPLVSESGDVFYELWTDKLNLIPEMEGRGNLVVPARHIIHDREITLHHPLIGVPPLCAAYWPAVKNLKILRSAAEFFANNAQPGGILSAPGSISDDTADRLSKYWHENFSGSKAGRVAVVGDNLSFVPLAAKSVDAQMIEQLRYSDEQICQPFGVPPYKVGIGALPAGAKVDDINNLYFSDALRDRVQHMEDLLDEGLALSLPLGIELDLWPLLRMDQEKLAKVEAEKVKGSISTPNEARKAFDRKPLDGGDTVYMQQQNYSLAALAKRDALDDPFANSTSSAPPQTVDAAPTKELIAALQRSISDAWDDGELFADLGMSPLDVIAER